MKDLGIDPATSTKDLMEQDVLVSDVITIRAIADRVIKFVWVGPTSLDDDWAISEVKQTL